MRKLIAYAFFVLLMGACNSAKRLQTAEPDPSLPGDTRTTEVEFLDANAYKLTELSTDETYGFDKSNPIKVGGLAESSGPLIGDF
jgi:hypothetical protein